MCQETVEIKKKQMVPGCCCHNFVILKLGTFLTADQKCLGCSVMWCWRRTEKIICTSLKNEVLQKVEVEMNPLQRVN
jgi:hypothetical protein